MPAALPHSRGVIALPKTLTQTLNPDPCMERSARRCRPAALPRCVIALPSAHSHAHIPLLVTKKCIISSSHDVRFRFCFLIPPGVRLPCCMKLQDLGLCPSAVTLSATHVTFCHVMACPHVTSGQQASECQASWSYMVSVKYGGCMSGQLVVHCFCKTWWLHHVVEVWSCAGTAEQSRGRGGRDARSQGAGGEGRAPQEGHQHPGRGPQGGHPAGRHSAMQTHGAPYKRHILRTRSTERSLCQFSYTCPCLWSPTLSVSCGPMSLFAMLSFCGMGVLSNTF